MRSPNSLFVSVHSWMLALLSNRQLWTQWQMALFAHSLELIVHKMKMPLLALRLFRHSRKLKHLLQSLLPSLEYQV